MFYGIRKIVITNMDYLTFAVISVVPHQIPLYKIQTNHQTIWRRPKKSKDPLSAKNAFFLQNGRKNFNSVFF
jgi:hypothetical protein